MNNEDNNAAHNQSQAKSERNKNQRADSQDGAKRSSQSSNSMSLYKMYNTQIVMKNKCLNVAADTQSVSQAVKQRLQ